MRMKQLQRGRLLLVVLIMTLVLLTHQKKNDLSSNQKQKTPEKKRCKDCIQVRVNKPENPPLPIFSTSFRDRAIVAFDYHTISIPGGIPDRIMEVICSTKCRGHEMDMNAVPIKRNIPYLKKEKKNLYVLHEITVTVGCTCVYPQIIEQSMT